MCARGSGNTSKQHDKVGNVNWISWFNFVFNWGRKQDFRSLCDGESSVPAVFHRKCCCLYVDAFLPGLCQKILTTQLNN